MARAPERMQRLATVVTRGHGTSLGWRIVQVWPPSLDSHYRVALHEPLTVTPYALAEHEKVPSTDAPVSEAENVPLASPSHSPETVRLAAPAASTNPDSDVMAPVAVPVMVPSETVRVTDPASVPYG